MFQTLSSLTALTHKEEPVQVVEAKSTASDFDGIRSVVEDSLADLHDKVEALMELAKSTGAVKLDTVKDKDGMTVFKKIKKLCDDAQQIKKLMTEAEAMVMQVAEGQVDEDEALLEDTSGYVLCLMKGDKCKGYYVSDDQNVTKSLKKALVYPNMQAAKKDADINNRQWDLTAGEKFVACKKEDCMKEVLSTTASLLEGKNYDDSAEFTEEFYGVVQKVNDIKRVVKAPRFMGWMKSTDHNFGPSLAGGDEDDMDAVTGQTCESVAREVIESVDSLAEDLSTLEKLLHNAS